MAIGPQAISQSSAQPLTLDPIHGPPVGVVEIAPGQNASIGRSSACEVVLADEAVSRRHASVHQANGTWFITDLGSRHGTMVNAVRLEPNGMAPLRMGDLVGIGPWTFRVRVGASGGGAGLVTTVDTVGRQRVERVAERELAAITQQRLNLLMDCAAKVAGATDRDTLARIVLNAAVEGTGFPRAALLEEAGGEGAEVKVLGEVDLTRAKGGEKAADATFSRSLIAAARSGEMVRMTADSPMNAGESIMRLGIQTALCAPVVIGTGVAAYLYLDSRAGETGGGRPGMGRTVVQHDAAAFCQAVAKMCAMSLGNINARELEERQRDLLRDLQTAQEAQRLIMPPDEGQIASVRYAVRQQSGRFVAGDLFDVVDLGGGRVAIFLGDVAGKGIGAAILMATAQTHLNASLKVHNDAAKAVTEVNAYISQHSAANKFISLWLGIFDSSDRSVSFVDAGHGHWLCITPGRPVERIETAGGIPLGIDKDFVYSAERLEITPESRVVLFSDGVVEQPGPEGLYGLERAIHALVACGSVNEDVAGLFKSVRDYSQTPDSLADDTTVASIQVV
jgi:serine phosphatase RsbU (regulator of sigma subunit)/pSer/pThr/pTyr-binding forkhead associated (FHA) protein